MKVATIVMGILLAIGGFLCALTPIGTFLMIGWVIGFILLVAGINLIVDYFTRRKDRTVTGWELAGGVLTVALALFILYRHGIGNVPISDRVLNDIILILFGAWMLISGTFRIASAMKLKQLGEKSWGWLLFGGILSIIIGIYGLVNPYAFKFAIGWMIGFSIMMQGINMIMLGASMGKGGDDDAAAA